MNFKSLTYIFQTKNCKFVYIYNMRKSIILIIILFQGFFVLCQTKKWSLQESVNYAIKNNISIKLSELDSKTAAIEKNGAIGNFLPTLNSNIQHAWNIGLNQNIITGTLENQTQQNTAVGLNVGVTIYSGMQNQNRLRRANLSIAAAQFQISKIKDDVALNVANAFLQILFNKENLKVQNVQLANTEKQLARTNELVNAGSVPKGDLFEIKATIASNKQNIVLAENALLISRLSLAQLLQLQDFKEFDVEESISDTKQSSIMLENPENILKKAKQERIELKIAKSNLEIAEKDITIAKGAFQPTLSAFYGFNTRAVYNDQVVGITPNTANPFSPIGFVEATGQTVSKPNFTPILGNPAPIFDQFSDFKGNSFGLQLAIPILNGFQVKNNVARNKVNLERNKIALQQSELDLERNVYNAYANAKGAQNAYESAKIALEARQNAVDFAKERFNVGMMNSFDYNQSQSLLVNAQSEVLRTKYDFIFKIKIVELYFGIPIASN
jgi:outer membrane protein TolC